MIVNIIIPSGINYSLQSCSKEPLKILLIFFFTGNNASLHSYSIKSNFRRNAIRSGKFMLIFHCYADKYNNKYRLFNSFQTYLV